jgi:hypothetical protein
VDPVFNTGLRGETRSSPWEDANRPKRKQKSSNKETLARSTGGAPNSSCLATKVISQGKPEVSLLNLICRGFFPHEETTSLENHESIAGLVGTENRGMGVKVSQFGTDEVLSYRSVQHFVEQEKTDDR